MIRARGCASTNARSYPGVRSDAGLFDERRLAGDLPSTAEIVQAARQIIGEEIALSPAAQWLQVPASHYLPVDGELIPFGEVAPVAGTPFDFRIARGLAIAAPHPQLEAGGGLDHCLVLDPGRGFTAALYSPHSGLAMRIDSDAPGLQLYGGQGLARQHPGLGDGICLEPQDYPDAPNRPAFPPAILAPGRDYRRSIRYRFARPGRDRGWDEVAHALRLDRPGLGSPSGVPA